MSEIDCALCIRSTFEAFIKGCDHREHYVDPYGTIRCAACKAELGQMEDSDVFEDTDPREIDDPDECDEDDILHLKSRIYASWNLDDRWNQVPPDR